MSPDARRALFLPILLAASAPAATPAPAAQQIGPYEIVATLGSGGMGTVYLAVQTGPVERQVALKVIREDVADPELRHQFWREAQALALANHDHIARLYQAGETAANEPWLAMEYVPGEPLLEYCDRRRLDLHQRLALVADICDAVQHLHDLGIHHRDVKSDNVLVVERDGRAVPKLIDLGLASLRLEPTAGDELRSGTLSHMAPEQFSLPDGEIDGRADVHALGVLLCEMLVGKLPFAPVDWSDPGGARHRFAREPLGPSERMAEADCDPDAIAAARNTTPAGLRRALRGIDTIARRCRSVIAM